MVDEDKTRVVEINFQNGIYYTAVYDMGGGKQIDQIKTYTDKNNKKYMHVGRGIFRAK